MSELQRYHMGSDSKLYRDGSSYPTSGGDAFVLADEAQAEIDRLTEALQVSMVKVDLCMSARQELLGRLEARDAEIDRLRKALEMCVTSMQDSGYPNNHIAVKAARAELSKGEKG